MIINAPKLNKPIKDCGLFCSLFVLANDTSKIAEITLTYIDKAVKK